MLTWGDREPELTSGQKRSELNWYWSWTVQNWTNPPPPRPQGPLVTLAILAGQFRMCCSRIRCVMRSFCSLGGHVVSNMLDMGVGIGALHVTKDNQKTMVVPYMFPVGSLTHEFIWRQAISESINSCPRSTTLMFQGPLIWSNAFRLIYSH